MTKPKSYETARLLLHPTTVDDAELFYELLNSPKWLQFIGDRKIKTPESAAAYIRAKMNEHWFMNFTVVRKADGEKLGACGLYERRGLDHKDIGFAFLPGYEGMGYAYEAAEKVKEIAFDEFGFEKIYAITRMDNHSSQKLLKKLGLARTGKFTIVGEREELLLYILAKTV